MKRSIVIAAAILATTLLGSCRQEEQKHPFVVGQGGTYTGPADSQLTQEQMDALDNRVMLQGTANVSGGAARRPSEERPSPSQVPSGELNLRVQHQAGPGQ